MKVAYFKVILQQWPRETGKNTENSLDRITEFLDRFKYRMY
jgi:hypothetical protein